MQSKQNKFCLLSDYIIKSTQCTVEKTVKQPYKVNRMASSFKCQQDRGDQEVKNVTSTETIGSKRAMDGPSSATQMEPGREGMQSISTPTFLPTLCFSTASLVCGGGEKHRDLKECQGNDLKRNVITINNTGNYSMINGPIIILSLSQTVQCCSQQIVLIADVKAEVLYCIVLQNVQKWSYGAMSIYSRSSQPIHFFLSPPGLALIMWNGLYTVEKIIIQWTLLSEACYFAIQFLGECTFLKHVSILSSSIFKRSKSKHQRCSFSQGDLSWKGVRNVSVTQKKTLCVDTALLWQVDSIAFYAQQNIDLPSVAVTSAQTSLKRKDETPSFKVCLMELRAMDNNISEIFTLSMC